MRDILDKCDVILSMDDPDFPQQLREALGVKSGDTVHIMTPEFNRTDGLQVPIPIMDFKRLPGLSEETLKAVGCQKWAEPDASGNVLWLFPAEWYDHIPNGLEVVSINGDSEKFHHGKTDNDRRFGALAFGFMRAA